MELGRHALCWNLKSPLLHLAVSFDYALLTDSSRLQKDRLIERWHSIFLGLFAFFTESLPPPHDGISNQAIACLVLWRTPCVDLPSGIVISQSSDTQAYSMLIRLPPQAFIWAWSFPCIDMRPALAWILELIICSSATLVAFPMDK